MSTPPNRTGLLPELAGLKSPARVAPQARRKSSTAERDALLDAAIKAGKFSEQRRAHYAALYDKNPEATAKLIQQLAAYNRPATGSSTRTGLLPELG